MDGSDPIQLEDVDERGGESRTEVYPLAATQHDGEVLAGFEQAKHEVVDEKVAIVLDYLLHIFQH